MTREEAIECIEAIHVQMFNSGNSKWTKACDMAIEALKDRPHGEWKIDSEYGYIFHCVCSKCNTDVMKYISGSENWWLNSVPYFCPNCGADMRKEGEAE